MTVKTSIACSSILAALCCSLASCAWMPEPPPPRREPRAAAARTATPISTAAPTPVATARPSFDDAPLGEGSEPAAGALPPGLDDLVEGDGSAPTAVLPESMLTRISASTPPNVAAAYRLIEEGRRLLSQDSFDQALQRFERSVAVDPSSAYGYYFLAEVHVRTHTYSQAIAFAGRAAALSSRRDRVCEARAYALQGSVYEKVGRFADARAVYTKALNSDPRNGEARLGLIRLSDPGENL